MSDLRSALTLHDQEELSAMFAMRVRFDEPLAAYTWWRIGGNADAYLELHTPAELAWVLEFCRRRRLAWFVLGNGSNILVGDGGIRGLVLRLLGEFTRYTLVEEGNKIIIEAGGGASLPALTGQAASKGAVGVDALAGVPATIGGAIRMNAGTDREIGAFARSVMIQSMSQPREHEVPMQYLYRRSSLAADAIVSQVRLVFAQGDVLEIREQLQQRLIRRKATQPVGLPNAGSCFRNPPGDYAARLIEAVGAKGWREGGACVSELHANFIVNDGQATAENVAMLLARVRAAVLAQCNVDLVFEVHFVGVFTSHEAPTAVGA